MKSPGRPFIRDEVSIRSRIARHADAAALLETAKGDAATGKRRRYHRAQAKHWQARLAMSGIQLSIPVIGY